MHCTLLVHPSLQPSAVFLHGVHVGVPGPTAHGPHLELRIYKILHSAGPIQAAHIRVAKLPIFTYSETSSLALLATGPWGRPPPGRKFSPSTEVPGLSLHSTGVHSGSSGDQATESSGPSEAAGPQGAAATSRSGQDALAGGLLLAPDTQSRDFCCSFCFFPV